MRHDCLQLTIDIDYLYVVNKITRLAFVMNNAIVFGTTAQPMPLKHLLLIVFLSYAITFYFYIMVDSFCNVILQDETVVCNS